MKNFIAITICFIVGLFVCQQANGQDLNQPSSAIHESDQLVVKFSECGQDCNFCDRDHARCVTKRMASRARAFTGRVFSRGCCR